MRYGWWGYQMMRRQSPLRREMGYYNTLLTTDTYNKEIKLFTLGDFFIDALSRSWPTLLRRGAGAGRAALPGGVRLGAGQQLVANGLIFLYVALQAVVGRITLGDLTLYTQAAISWGSSFQGLLGGVSSMYENNLFLNTLFDFLDYEPRIVSPPRRASSRRRDGLSIEFRNVTFTYPGREEPARRSRTSASRFRRARRWRWWGATARARRPSSSC